MQIATSVTSAFQLPSRSHFDRVISLAQDFALSLTHLLFRFYRKMRCKTFIRLQGKIHAITIVMLFWVSLSIQLCGDWVQGGSDIDEEVEDDETEISALSSDGSTVAIGANQNDGNGSDLGHEIISVNDAPTLTGAGRTLSFTENDGATATDYILSAMDADDAELESVTFTIFSSNVSSEDVLGFTNLRLRPSLTSEHRKIYPENKAVNWFSFMLKRNKDG